MIVTVFCSHFILFFKVILILFLDVFHDSINGMIDFIFGFCRGNFIFFNDFGFGVDFVGLESALEVLFFNNNEGVVKSELRYIWYI